MSVSFPASWRRAGTGLCVALLCASLLVPMAGAAGADPQSELERVQREQERRRGGLEDTRSDIEDTRSDLEGVDRERSATTEDLEEADARRAALDAQVAELTTELQGAQAELADAESRLERTTAELTATEEELDETEANLADQREVFSDRARQSYMHGGNGANLASAMTDMDDFRSFTDGMKYAERVLADDRQRVDMIASLAREVEAQARELAALQERRQEERAVAADERDRVAGLVDEREAVRDEAEAEAERHRQILAELDEDRQTHVALIDSLEDESERLESELANLAEEEAEAEEAIEAERRREEERRRREEERRRAEEAEARRVAQAEAEAEEARRAEAARQAEARREEQRASRSASSNDAQPSSSQPSGSSPDSAPSSGSQLARPSNGPVTSSYGQRRHPIYGTTRMHTGTDFGAPSGAPVFAADGGTVVSAGWRGGYGNAVVVNHGGGMTTLYAHMSGFSVSAGQQVSRGQTVGSTGSTGYSTGPHLHFEVRMNGSPTNPMGYL